MSEHIPKIAILASGSGSTAEAFIHAAQDGRVTADVGLIVCNNPPDKAGIYDRIVRLNQQYDLEIEIAMINGKTHPGGPTERGQTLEESEVICDLVSSGGFALVVLMGYMKQVGGSLMEEYGWIPGKYESIHQARMINTHPGPLPETADFWGIHASEEVLRQGLPASRHTIHLAAPKIDEGPILAQNAVKIKQGDTAQDLFDRVQLTEKAVLPLVIDQFLREQYAYQQALQ